MKIAVTFILTLAVWGGIQGCQTTAEYLATFHGKHTRYLIGEIGMPDTKLPDAHDGEIWQYETRTVYTTPGKEEVVYTVEEEDGDEDGGGEKKITETREIYPPSRSVRLYLKTFYINKDGYVYDTAAGSRPIED